MYAEMFSGLNRNPREFLRKSFVQKYDEMVRVKDIAFESLCEHHLLPFFGKAHVAYLPNGRIVGLSKLGRAVEVLSRRPQVQERITEELADLLMQQLDARGVGVILEASHTCMTVRGIHKPGSVCTTSAMRGVFKDNQPTRAEFMALVYGSGEMHAGFFLSTSRNRPGRVFALVVAETGESTFLSNSLPDCRRARCCGAAAGLEYV